MIKTNEARLLLWHFYKSLLGPHNITLSYTGTTVSDSKPPEP